MNKVKIKVSIKLFWTIVFFWLYVPHYLIFVLMRVCVGGVKKVYFPI